LGLAAADIQFTKGPDVSTRKGLKGSLIAGWEVEWEGQSAIFISLDGGRFDSLKKAQDYCKQKHLFKPPSVKKKMFAEV
jgi:hypothetical protein